MNASESRASIQPTTDELTRLTVQHFLDTASIAVSIKNRAGRYLFANQFFCSLVGLDLQQVLGRCATDIFPPATAELMRMWDVHVLSTVTAADSEIPLFQGTTVRTYGEKRFPLVDSTGQVYAIGIITFDMTDHKHEQEQLQHQQETSVVFHERERLVLEIQTTIGQMLDHVATQTQAAYEALSAGNETQAGALLTDVQALVRETRQRMHASTLDINRNDQDEPTFAALYAEKGFVPALREYVQRFATRSNIPIAFDVPAQLQQEEFPPRVQIHLLHIIQEALLNIQSRQSPPNVNIRLELVQRTLILTITDDGYQAPHQSNPLQGQRRITDHIYGLRRIYEIGGEFQVEHGQQHGMTIQVHIPLRRAGDLQAATLRVLLADAQAATLQHLHDMLVLYGIQVVGLARNDQEVQEMAHSLKPDILLIDIGLLQTNNLEATWALKTELPDIHIVALADTLDDAALFDAIKSGALGYLLKSLPSDELIGLLLSVQRGEVALSPAMAHKVLTAFARQDLLPTDVQADTTDQAPVTLIPDLSSQLSSRQMEILWLVAQDYTYKQVGDILGFSERTIKHYMSGIIKQLHLRNRADAVAFVRQRMTNTRNAPSSEANS